MKEKDIETNPENILQPTPYLIEALAPFGDMALDFKITTRKDGSRGIQTNRMKPEWYEMLAEMEKEARSYYRIMLGYDDPEKFFILETNASCEYEYDTSRYLSIQKFDTEAEAMEFAKEAYNHPECPEHIKRQLKPLAVESVINIDYMFHDYRSTE